MNRTSAYKHFHALLGELGLRDRKYDILSGYGVESTTELSDEQLIQLIGTLEAEKQTRMTDTLRRQRSRVLRLLTDMGVYYVEPGEPKQACWCRVNDFLASPRIAGKVLYKMNAAELTSLVGRLHSMIDKGYVYRRRSAEQQPTKHVTPVVVIVDPSQSGSVN